MSLNDRSGPRGAVFSGTELRCSSGSLPCRGEGMGFSSGLTSSLSRLDLLRFKRPNGFVLAFFVDDCGDAVSRSPADDKDRSLRRGSAETGLCREWSQ